MQPLSQVLILLAAAVLLVTAARRLGLPTAIAYLLVGLGLGPHALAVVASTATTRVLAELGVVFLLFTLGLEFALPRLIAMRREVFGLGSAQVAATAAVFALLARLGGIAWPPAIVVGGALAMSSTAILLHQLTERAELNRTHGRLAFAMLLFQDLAFVPFLALASALAAGPGRFELRATLEVVAGGVLAVAAVLAAGRWLLRPLFREMAHSRLRELFTLAVLLVVLAAAWVSSLARLSPGLGAFLAGMMLAETEYRHQIESVIRPFRDILLGLFFISVGMLLDVHLLAGELGAVIYWLAAIFILKTAVAALVSRPFTGSRFKALRTGIVISIGGEFGVALGTIALATGLIPGSFGEPLLVAIVLSMILSPLILNNNKRIARLLLRESGPPRTAFERESAATGEIGRRDHVILCGFGRVGQNVARVLESQGFEYIALDLDPARIAAARQAGDPVIFGDSADEAILAKAGLETATVVVISFSDPATSVGILRSIRRLRPDVPVLVRTQDDARIKELQEAGATDVVPETFEASLMLVSHVLILLHVPVSRVVRTMGEIRSHRYSVLRNIIRRGDARPLDESHEYREEIKSVVVPPGAWAVGRTLRDVRSRGVGVTFTGIRRQGILGREPAGDTVLRDGDVVVLYGQPEELERAESVLLAG
ncbi:MAG TPA: cation:proton antiporter [Steroidobacteraceae bacterium]|nr:cation:proton antiporter [Steroidobacteraceae bacterium]